jgi:hypothetical protein
VAIADISAMATINRALRFLIAAAFGLAPNLIISELQQRTANLSSDLQKSKSIVQESQTN